MAQLFTNNAIDLLATALGSSDMQFQVRSGKGDLFPQPIATDDFFLVTLENENGTLQEIIKIKERHGDLFIVDSRGWEGTIPKDWAVLQTLVDHRITAGTLQSLASTTSNNLTSNMLTVNAHQTVNADNLLITPINRTCKWMVAILDNTSFDAMMVEILAISRGQERQPTFLRYAQVGDKIDVDFNVTQNGNYLELIITNNTSTTLNIEVTRINSFS